MRSRLILPPEAVEITQLRTRHSKTLDMGAGRRRFIAQTSLLHVPDDVDAYRTGLPVNWQDADLDIEVNPLNGHLGVRNAWYRIVVDPAEIGFQYTSRLNGFAAMRLLALDGVPVTIPPAPRINGNEIWWDNIAPDLDIFIRFDVGRAEMFKRLRSALAPRALLWQIRESDPPILELRTITQGMDNADRSNPARVGLPLGQQRRQIELTHSQTPFVTPAPGIRQYRLTETWTGRTFHHDHSVPEEPKVFTNEVSYPVLIDVLVSETIAADGDDGMERRFNNNWFNSYGASGDHVSYGVTDLQRRQPGYRFQTVALPQGQVLDDATFTVNIAAAAGATHTATLAGNDIDDAPAWASTSVTPELMTKTTATVSWVLPNATGNYAVDVKAIIQEIIDRAGWASGNDLALGSTGILTGTGICYINDLAGGASNIATLAVNYTVAGGRILIHPGMRGGMDEMMGGLNG